MCCYSGRYVYQFGAKIHMVATGLVGECSKHTHCPEYEENHALDTVIFPPIYQYQLQEMLPTQPNSVQFNPTQSQSHSLLFC